MQYKEILAKFDHIFTHSKEIETVFAPAVKDNTINLEEFNTFKESRNALKKTSEKQEHTKELANFFTKILYHRLKYTSDSIYKLNGFYESERSYRDIPTRSRAMMDFFSKNKGSGIEAITGEYKDFRSVSNKKYYTIFEKSMNEIDTHEIKRYFSHTSRIDNYLGRLMIANSLIETNREKIFDINLLNNARITLISESLKQMAKITVDEPFIKKYIKSEGSDESIFSPADETVVKYILKLDKSNENESIIESEELRKKIALKKKDFIGKDILTLNAPRLSTSFSYLFSSLFWETKRKENKEELIDMFKKGNRLFKEHFIIESNDLERQFDCKNEIWQQLNDETRDDTDLNERANSIYNFYCK